MFVLAGTFKKELGLFQLTMFGIGAILGAGWLFAPAKAAAIAGPSEIYAWLIAGVMLMLVALVYAELGSSFPTAGGVAKYSDYSHGPLLGFITGWSIFLAGVSYSALEAVASAQALSFLYPPLASRSGSGLSVLGIGIAFAFLLLFFSLNLAGVRKVGGFISFLTLLKFLVPVMVLSFVFSFRFNPSVLTSASLTPSSLGGVLMAISAGGIISTYSGFRQPIDMAAEAKNPKKDIPRAVILSTAVSIALYTMLGAAFLMAVDWHAMGIPIGNWKALLSLHSSPFIDAAASLGAIWLVVLMLLDSVYSPMGESGVYFTTSSRISFAMAEQGYFPKIFAELNDEGVPVKALLLGLALSALFIVPFPSWYQMVEVASGLTVITYSMGPVSSAILSAFTSDGFRLPAGKVLRPAAFVVTSFLIYWFGWPYTTYVIGLALLGIPIYAIYARRLGTIYGSIRAAAWYFAYLLTLLLFSYLGSPVFGGMGLIRQPLDLVGVMVSAFAFYAAGVKSGMPRMPPLLLSSAFEKERKRLQVVIMTRKR
ncbi:MAG: APC family permease [Thermoprotei archaeon]